MMEQVNDHARQHSSPPDTLTSLQRKLMFMRKLLRDREVSFSFAVGLQLLGATERQIQHWESQKHQNFSSLHTSTQPPTTSHIRSEPQNLDSITRVECKLERDTCQSASRSDTYDQRSDGRKVKTRITDRVGAEVGVPESIGPEHGRKRLCAAIEKLSDSLQLPDSVKLAAKELVGRISIDKKRKRETFTVAMLLAG